MIIKYIKSFRYGLVGNLTYYGGVFACFYYLCKKYS